eukprot:CAMPEP_0194067482 /NCGR_PEP_ID=MMETSP0009_2-20130614/86580_1 /TAXON_ID=210454 /ORGANISM="Grammatophora oceanica, Strain CCMP 410" /LENGTH=440 /DNA_ID=CAMNT_0038720511 /DNA_START=1 /DNA_END=1320 /DNA_ORIENTATION=-
MNFYGWQNKTHDAMDVGLHMMKLLGEKLPTKAGKIHVAWEFVLAKRALGQKSDGEILAMPKATNWRDLAVLVALREIGTAAYFTQPDLMMVSVIRAFRLTLRYGFYSEVSPTCWASFGFLHFHIGKEKEAMRYMKLSLALLERGNSRYIRPITASLVYGLGLHQRQPIESIYKPLLDGKMAGEKYGDTGHGLICANMSCIVKLMIGTPLGEVEKLLDRYIVLMKAYNRKGVLVLTCHFHQRVLNLMGHSDRPTILTGKAMNQSELQRELEESGNEVGLVMLLDNLFQINCIFEQWEHAHKYYKELQKYAEALKTLETHPGTRQNKFFTALFCLVWHRKTGRKKYWSKAQRIVSLLKEQQAAGSPNNDCFIPILDAEMSASKATTKDKVHAAYWKAVDACKYVHLRALAHERAASVIEKSFGDRFLAKEHLQAAKRHYTVW